jgi:hypothetical protein
MRNNHPTLTIALPEGQQWTCHLRPEIVAQFVAAAQHATQVLRATSPDCDVQMTPADCAVRELEMALWGRLFQTVTQQIVSPPCPLPTQLPGESPGQPRQTNPYDLLTKQYRRLRKAEDLEACDIGFRWCRALQERYDSGDVTDAHAEVYTLIDWLRHMMAYEPDNRHIVQAYAHSLELLGNIEEYRFMSTGIVSARFHAGVLYQAALVACDEARLSANNSTRAALRAALARTTTELLEQDQLDDELRYVLQPALERPDSLDALLARQITPASPAAWSEAIAQARRRVAQFRQQIKDLPGEGEAAHLIDRDVVLRLLGAENLHDQDTTS